MKIRLAAIAMFILAMADPVLGYHVEEMKNCKPLKEKSREIVGTPRSVIVGERPFLTIVTENGDELILLDSTGGSIHALPAVKTDGRRVTASAIYLRVKR